MRGATCSLERLRHIVQISTHTPHAGRDKIGTLDRDAAKISTHTPHAGRDISFRLLSV